MFLSKKYFLLLILLFAPSGAFGVSVKDGSQLDTVGSEYLNILADRVAAVTDAAGIATLSSELKKVPRFKRDSKYRGLVDTPFDSLTQLKAAHENLVSKLEALADLLNKMTPVKTLAKSIQAIGDFWDSPGFESAFTAKQNIMTEGFFDPFDEFTAKLVSFYYKFVSANSGTPAAKQPAKNVAAK